MPVSFNILPPSALQRAGTAAGTGAGGGSRAPGWPPSPQPCAGRLPPSAVLVKRGEEEGINSAKGDGEQRGEQDKAAEGQSCPF